VLADRGCTDCGTVSAELCDSLFIGIWCLCLLVTAMLFLWKGQTDRLGCDECWQTGVVLIVVRLVLYCVAICISVFGVSVC
jgi:hypothetical protein